MVARELALIAEPRSMCWIDDIGTELKIDFNRKPYGLFCNGTENALYMLPMNKAKKRRYPRGKKSLKKVFKTFTAFDAGEALEIEIPDNRTELKKIGYLTSILYDSDKWTGEKITYVHEYKKRVICYADRLNLGTARVFGAMSERGARLLSRKGLI